MRYVELIRYGTLPRTDTHDSSHELVLSHELPIVGRFQNPKLAWACPARSCRRIGYRQSEIERTFQCKREHATLTTGAVFTIDILSVRGNTSTITIPQLPLLSWLML